MWKLVRLSLAYHLKALVLAWLIALLLSNFGLFIVVVVAAYLVSAEDKERRLLLLLPLPVTRLQVGWARVVFPAVVFLVGALVTISFTWGVLAVVFSTGVPGGGGATVTDALWDDLVLAAVLLFFLQLLLMLGELNSWASGRGLPRLLMALLTLVVVLMLTLIVWMQLAMLGSYPGVLLGTVGLTVVLMAVTVVFFERRPSFASR